MTDERQRVAEPIAPVLLTPSRADLVEALAGLGLTGPRPVLVLVGGAANLPPSVAEALLVLFEVLSPELDVLGVTLIDGGTAFGVMALMGQARRDSAARFPLVGVAARGTIALASLPSRALVRVLPGALSGEPPGASRNATAVSDAGAPLDPNHSHFLLVPGECWGDESAWMSAAAACLAAARPSLTLVAAGGRITRLDVATGLKAGRRLVVLAGTGGTADLLADWWRHGRGIPDLPLGATEHALIQVVEMADAADRLPDILAQTFASSAE